MLKTTTKLHGDIVFGPIKSRRLGLSLGVNLSPIGRKICTFNCIYCECGFNVSNENSLAKFPAKDLVIEKLEDKLKELKKNNSTLDSITFSGNGEPTLHPDFSKIIDEVILLRNRYFSDALISVFSNATQLNNESVFKALNKVDNNILKLDAGSDELLRIIDQPVSNSFSLKELMEQLKEYNGNLIIQTLFLRGSYEGKSVDNTSEENIKNWLDLLKEIQPQQVMIYSLDRATPADGLIKVEKEELTEIASRVKKLGIKASVA